MSLTYDEVKKTMPDGFSMKDTLCGLIDCWQRNGSTPIECLDKLSKELMDISESWLESKAPKT